MTATSNIHYNLAAWIGSHVYTSVGTRVNHSNVAYQLTTSGTSGTGGPTGTGSSISDGTCVWKWLSAVDYTSVAAWAAAFPNPLTQAMVGLLWNNGPITTTTGVRYLDLETYTSSASTPVTLMCATGESFRDVGVKQQTALNYNSANGVCFQLPSGAGNTTYFWVGNEYFTLDGIQFISSDPASNSSIVTLGANATMRNCLLDGYSSIGNNLAWIQDISNIYNCLFIDRNSSNTFGSPSLLIYNGTANIVNCTFFCVPGNADIQGVDASGSSGSSIIRNCIFLGYSGVPVGGTSGSTLAIDHCQFSNASNSFMAANGGTDGGSNLYSATAAGLFVSSTNDFRLKSTATAINHGATDTTHVPTSDDIVGTTRPQDTAWDIGCWEYKAPGGPRLIIAD